MAIRKDTIKQQLHRIRAAFPQRNLNTGQIYNHGNEQRGKFKTITLYSLFVSDEGTFLVRPHVFKSADLRSASEWENYLADSYGEILPRILDGMAARTGKQWRNYRIIGWTKNDTSQLKNRPARIRRNNKSKKGSNKNA
jgi:hypothetical protein